MTKKQQAAKQQAALWKACDIGREEGMIQAWKHIGYILQSCIKAHKKQLKWLTEKKAK